MAIGTQSGSGDRHHLRSVASYTWWGWSARGRPTPRRSPPAVRRGARRCSMGSFVPPRPPRCSPDPGTRRLLLTPVAAVVLVQRSLLWVRAWSRLVMGCLRLAPRRAGIADEGSVL